MMLLLPLLVAEVLQLFSVGHTCGTWPPLTCANALVVKLPTRRMKFTKRHTRTHIFARPSCASTLIKEVLEVAPPSPGTGHYLRTPWWGSSDKDMARVRVRMLSLGTCTDKPTTKQRREARHDVTWHLAVFLAFSVRVVASGDRYGDLSQRWTCGEALPLPWLRPARGCPEGCGDNRPGVSPRQGSAVRACDAKEEQDPCQVDRS